MSVAEITSLREAAQEAFGGRGDAPKAVALLEVALELARKLPSERDAQAMEATLHFDIRRPLLALHKYEDVEYHLRRAEDLVSTLGDTDQLAQAEIFLAHLHWRLGRPAQARAEAERARERSRQAGTPRSDDERSVEAAYRLGQILNSLGSYEEAVEAFRSCIPPLERGLIVLPEVRGDIELTVRSWIVWCLIELGAFHRGFREGRYAMKQAVRRRNGFSIAFAMLVVGNLLLARGEVRRAIHYLQEGQRRRPGMREGSDIFTPRYLSSLGAAYAEMGRLEVAIPLLEKATSWIARSEAGGPSGWLGNLGTGYLLAGRLREAEAVVLQALSIAEDRGERGYEAWATKRLGDIRAAGLGSGADESLARYHQAWQVARQLHMRPLLAHCELGLGKGYLRRGDTQGAVSHLERAARSYRSMGMHRWLAQADDLLRHSSAQ